jgi:hypothetical protein
MFMTIDTTVLWISNILLKVYYSGSFLKELYLGFSKFESRTKTIHQSQSQSHTVTDGQSVSKSWCRAPSWAHDQNFITV